MYGIGVCVFGIGVRVYGIGVCVCGIRVGVYGIGVCVCVSERERAQACMRMCGHVCVLPAISFL